MTIWSPEIRALAGKYKREILAQVEDKTDPRYLELVAADPILSAENADEAGDRAAAGEHPATLSRVTRFVRLPALISATLAPLIFIGGTVVAEFAFPSFNPVAQTISELAAGDAPTRYFMTGAFLATSLCHIVTATFATGIGWPGRVLIMIAAVASIGVALNPLPTMAGTSIPHRLFAIVGFIALAAWPLFGMRRGREFPWVIRPLGAITVTAVMTVFCFAFLAVWSSPQLGFVGVAERVAADLESLAPALIVWSLWFAGRRAADAGAPVSANPAAP